MTAHDIRQALLGRWPDDKFLNIDEAPQSCDRGGRRIDRLVVSLWRSRGLELDAVEIKVSYSDWRTELKAIEKADFWFRHVHRFWIAAPADLAKKIKPEAPAPWGLLSCAEWEGDTPGRVTVLKKPERHDAEPLPWSTTVGIMRASADAGSNALQRAEQAGYRRGEEDAKRRQENGFDKSRWQSLYEKQKRKIEALEEASGLDLSNEWEIPNIGEAVALVLAEMRSPGRTLQHIGGAAERAKQNALAVVETAERLQAVSEQLNNALADARAAALSQTTLFPA